MARRELGPAALQVAQAVADALPSGPVVVGVSGGADSLALALGAVWAAPRRQSRVHAIVVDHGLQAGSAAVAEHVQRQLTDRGLACEIRTVTVENTGQGPEADARDARLAALREPGHPVLLGHTLDDQAEQVLLGLLRGSGTRSLAGMPARREQFLRPLLGLRRQVTAQACREWRIEPWQDPHNADERYTRVRARRQLGQLSAALGRDLAPILARTADLARIDADYLDELAEPHVPDGHSISAPELAALPDALRLRVVREWLRRGGLPIEMVHILAVDALITGWRGQGPVAVPGARVARRGDSLVLIPRPGVPNVGL